MEAPTERQRWQIDYYMNTDLDSIWISLGLATKKPSGEPFDPDQAKQIGQAWFESKKDELYKIVCDDWNYAEKIKDEWYQNKHNLAYTISELIRDKVGLMAPLTVASLMVRLGLKKPCER